MEAKQNTEQSPSEEDGQQQPHDGYCFLGIRFNSDAIQGTDYKEIAARLFVSSRIPCDRVNAIVNNLESGKMSMDSFLRRTDFQIDQLRNREEDFTYKMSLKIDDWIDNFGFRPEQIDFITEHFGFTFDDLNGKCDSAQENLSLEPDIPFVFHEDDFAFTEMDDEVECDVEGDNAGLADEQDEQRLIPQKSTFDTIVKTFKELPTYNYYYRFFTPVEYCHPHFEECSEELWVVLYQLLWGSLDVNCHLEEQLDGSFELVFCDEDGWKSCVSDLGIDEVYVLAMRLLVDLGIGIFHLMDPENLNAEVEIEYREGELIAKEEFFSFFNQEVYSSEDTVLATLSKMYDRIVQCDSESFPYCC